MKRFLQSQRVGFALWRMALSLLLIGWSTAGCSDPPTSQGERSLDSGAVEPDVSNTPRDADDPDDGDVESPDALVDVVVDPGDGETEVLDVGPDLGMEVFDSGDMDAEVLDSMVADALDSSDEEPGVPDAQTDAAVDLADVEPDARVVLNACGGQSQLEQEPGSPCGLCSNGTLQCDGNNALRCEDERINACGGCAELAHEPGSSCRGCNHYICTDTETVICAGEPACVASRTRQVQDYAVHTFRDIDLYSTTSFLATGDVNNDGFFDILVENDIPSSAFLMYGPFPRDREISLAGEAQVYFAQRTAKVGLGDINGDQYDDVIVASSDHYLGYSIYFGPVQEGVYCDHYHEGLLDCLRVNEPDWRIDYLPNSLISGSGINSLGDINDDGADDFVFTSTLRGRISLWLNPLRERTELLQADAMFEFDSATNAGSAPINSGDVNGDGIADILIGAEGSRPTNILVQGGAYLFYGPLEGRYRLDGANAVVAGSNIGSALGNRAIVVEDQNNDGFDDLMLTSPSGYDRGRTYLIIGPPAQLTYSEDINISFIGWGIEREKVGYNLASKDINRDGFGDLFLTGRFEGDKIRTYVFFGPVAPSIYRVDSADIVLTDEARNLGGCIGFNPDHGLFYLCAGSDDDRPRDEKIYFLPYEAM